MDTEKVRQTMNRMIRMRAAIMRENPFFGHLAMGLRLACAPCGTACTDGSRLIFDPAFAARLSDEEIQFVILHEVLHCVLAHCTRGQNRHAFLYNVACDQVVNSTILDMWGLDSYSLDGKEAMHLAPDGKEGRLHNAEEIYQMLLQRVKHAPRGTGDTAGMDAGRGHNAEQNDMDAAEWDLDAGSGNPDTAWDHDSMGGPNAQNGTSALADLYSRIIDRHDLWHGIADKHRLRDEWNDRIRKAVNVCGDMSGMPPNIRRIVKTMESSAGVNWRQILHDFLQFDTYDYTYCPPDRRFTDADYYLPGFNVNEEYGEARNLWICVDTSGSIRDKALASAMAEIRDAMWQVGLQGQISFFDRHITAPVPFETVQELDSITPIGGGGTNYHVIFQYLQEYMNAELPAAILIFTDGYAEWPVESVALGVPVLWAIAKDGREEEPSWGQVIRI